MPLLYNLCTYIHACSLIRFLSLFHIFRQNQSFRIRCLSDEPSESEYINWKKMLEKFILKAKVPVDEQLDALSSLFGHQSYPLIEDCTTYTEVIAPLDAKYAKSASAIMTRHKLRSLKQGTETIEEEMPHSGSHRSATQGNADR